MTKNLGIFLTAIFTVGSSESPVRAQGAPASELLLSEVRIAGEEEWVEVVSNSPEPVELALYTIELLDFAGRLRPESLFTLMGNSQGKTVLGPMEYITVSCDPDADGGTVRLIREPGDGVPKRRVLDDFEYRALPVLQGLEAYGRDPQNGQWCAENRWTRGGPNAPCAPQARPQVVLNEVNTNSGFEPGCADLVQCPFQIDWAELRWTGEAEQVDLSDYVLENRGFIVEFPAGAILDAEQPLFVVLFAGEGGLLGVAQPPGSIEAPELLSRDGDSLLLYREVAELPGGFPEFDWDSVRVPPLLEGELYARENTPAGPGDWDFTDVPTLGSDNVVEFAGRKPFAEVIDRFPFRVHPGDEVEVYAEVVDRDGWDDVKEVTMDFSLTPEGGEETISDSAAMSVDKRVYCERIDDELVYRGLIPGDFVSELGTVAFTVTVRDGRDNVFVTRSHEVHVQAEDWQDSEQFTHRIRINEISANTNPDDPGPKFDPRCHDCQGDWVELYNPLPVAVDLSGCYLTQNILNLDLRKLPSDTVIAPFGYLVVCFDAVPGAGIHLPYRLDRCRDEVILIHRDGRHVIDFIAFQEEKPDRTFGRVPDGGDKLGLLFPTPCQKNIVQFTARFTTAPWSPLVINEVSADNKTIRADRGGEFGDYIEIYNRSALPVSLDGWNMMDRNIEIGDTRRPPWPFPAGVELLQGQWLIVWCDNDTEENLEPADGVWGTGLDPAGDGELHTNFELNRKQDAVVLMDPLDRVADRIDFEDQLRDIPIGRSEDGGANTGLVLPSPGEMNTPAFVAGDLFQRGDVDGSGDLDISDPIALLGHLFLGVESGVEPPRCLDAADTNDDGLIDVSDPIANLFFQFVGGVEMPPPVGQCGRDPTDDQLLPCAYSQALCNG